MKAEEPATAYYTPAMVNAMRQSVLRHLEQETDTERLEKIYSLYSPDGQTFGQRYEAARAFAMKYFDEDTVRDLAAHNFMVDQPPVYEPLPETEEEWEALEKRWDEEEKDTVPHEQIVETFRRIRHDYSLG